jgi:protein-L-isoaspartate(D-aspartate) O-methyltransferase
VAYEIDPALAEKAAGNLADRPNVSVRNVSGTAAALPSGDAIYVNAGATHPLATWLDALRPHGRLLFPLTPDKGFGGMLLVTRGADRDYAARFVCLAGFIPCDGAREPEAERRLAQAVHGRSLWTVTSLHRGTDPDESCWLAGDGWWLGTG